jgi:murein DD-endopeptidase MepM/ murein hydrolase activator NlpD
LPPASISRGERIGYSGNTGDSSYPHLHFFAQQVVEECHDAEARTADLSLCPHVPVSFSSASPGDIISALAIEFGPTHIKSRELTALQRNFDPLLGSGTPLLYQGYTRVVGFDQRKFEKEFDL